MVEQPFYTRKVRCSIHLFLIGREEIGKKGRKGGRRGRREERRKGIRKEIIM